MPWESLARYLAGELTGERAAELERWIAADPARAAFVDSLRPLWTGAGAQRRDWDAESALRRIKQSPAEPARVIHLPAFYRDQPRSLRRRVTLLGIGAAAAAAIVAVVLGTPRRPTAPAPAVFEVSTTRGQRASVNLSDGSKVVLGPLSNLRYTAAANGPRTVHLQGHALFTVIHDSTRRFTVHTTHGAATDLGTRFVVRDYPNDSSIVVAVVEGEVSLRGNNKSTAERAADTLLLVAGDRGEARANGLLTLERGADVGRDLAWSEGRLEFRSVPMRDVIVELARWYDLDIRLASAALRERRLTASFKDESIDEVLRLIRASLDVRVERQGKIVTIKAR